MRLRIIAVQSDCRRVYCTVVVVNAAVVLIVLARLVNYTATLGRCCSRHREACCRSALRLQMCLEHATSDRAVVAGSV